MDREVMRKYIIEGSMWLSFSTLPCKTPINDKELSKGANANLNKAIIK